MNLPETPSYMPKVISKTDLNVALDTLLSDRNLGNISGLVIDIRQVMNFRESMKQSLIRGKNAVSKSSELAKKSKTIIVDPMTNYLGKVPIRDSLMKNLEEDLPEDLMNYLKRTQKGTFDRADFIENCKKWIKSTNFSEAFIQIQNKCNAGIMLQPYFTIYKTNFEEMLELNIQLAKQSMNHAKRVLNKTFGVVVCVDKILLRDTGRLEQIFLKFKEIDADWCFLKVDNFNSESRDENYESIRKFFQLARKIFGKNIFFLDINEFALILSLDKIRVFSFPMYTSTAFIIPKVKEPPLSKDGRYVNPESMKRLKKRGMRYLPCSCHYCSPFAERSVSSIEDFLWQRLRREHWIWWLDDEIRKILDADDTGLSESLKQRFERTIHREWVDLI